MPRDLLAALAWLLVVEGVSHGQRPTSRGENRSLQEKKIASFETPADLQKIKLHGVRVKLVQEHPTDGRQALQVDFEQFERPNVSFPSSEAPWDWRGYGALAMDLTNPSDEPIDFVVRIDDDPLADDTHHSLSGYATLGPHQSVSYAFPLPSWAPMQKGMRGGPPRPGIEPLTDISNGRLDEAHITAFQILLDRPPAPRTLILENVRLLSPVSYEGIVDAFGQYARADWPGKLKEEAEFARRRAEEEAQIQAVPALPDRDEYGGWARGPELQASGFFRTVKRNDKWWLVTPSGHLFFSLGVDVVGTSEGPTLVEGREYMFTWLPAPPDPLAKHYGYTEDILYGPTKKGRTFDFYSANLERKYGPEYLAKMRAFALDRLRAWGFNTIAAWSDPDLFTFKRIPYTVTLDVKGDFARVSSGSDYWGKMPDPFDIKLVMAAEQSIRQQALQFRDDPWCIGYFVDNEISWGSDESDKSHYGLVYGTLAGKGDQPGKLAFLHQLQLRYPKIKNLNAAWSTKFPSWDALLDRAYEPRVALTPQMKEDFGTFLKAFARQYFRIVNDTLKRYDPNHLYLGCRFAWRTPEAVEASAEICDVVSFNIYQRRVDPKKWDFANALNKPCIIGEFHFGALDRGMFHPGLVSTPNQQARAAMYRDYLQSVIDHPAFVGCAWFEYVDEPLTGRAFDGENYNIGFVNVTDTPYPDMVTAAKSVHTEVYSRRAKN